MALRLRLTRAGARNRPFYRVVVANSRSPRDGKFIENVGIYDPSRNPIEVRFHTDRLSYWISQGAQPTETVAYLMKQAQKKDSEKTESAVA